MTTGFLFARELSVTENFCLALGLTLSRDLNLPRRTEEGLFLKMSGPNMRDQLWLLSEPNGVLASSPAAEE